jgi:hypothetical protein
MIYLMHYFSIYRYVVLNTAWKRDPLHIMIFVNICSTWFMVQIKTRFETWVTKEDVNGVNLFNLYYLITLVVYLCSQWTTNVQIIYFNVDWSNYRLFVLNRGWKRESFQIMIFECLLDMKHSWTKNAFWEVNNKKWRKCCKFVSPYLFNNT